MLSTVGHRFHQLWSEGGWHVRRSSADAACWGDDPARFFDDVWWGRDCARNWYTGNHGGLGRVDGGPTEEWVRPHFTAAAPALLGFDESIEAFCTARGGRHGHAEMCVEVNHNILSLYGNAIRYNTCRNLEWQSVCGARTRDRPCCGCCCSWAATPSLGLPRC
jgi:hypothetical protein